MAVTTPAVDMDKLMTFLGQVIGELGATVNAVLVVGARPSPLVRVAVRVAPASAFV